jgi:NADH:ubiquinone oxidoreductase subunit E
MKKLKVDICMGTTCHIFGAADLMRVAELVPEAQRGSLEIRGVNCLAACRDDNFGGAPFVRIGERIISKATVNDVLEEIERQLGEARP